MEKKLFHAEIEQIKSGEIEQFDFESESDGRAKEILDSLYGNTKVWRIIKLEEVILIQNSNPIVQIRVVEETFFN